MKKISFILLLSLLVVFSCSEPFSDKPFNSPDVPFSPTVTNRDKISSLSKNDIVIKNNNVSGILIYVQDSFWTDDEWNNAEGGYYLALTSDTNPLSVKIGESDAEYQYLQDDEGNGYIVVFMGTTEEDVNKNVSENLTITYGDGESSTEKTYSIGGVSPMPCYEISSEGNGTVLNHVSSSDSTETGVTVSISSDGKTATVSGLSGGDSSGEISIIIDGITFSVDGKEYVMTDDYARVNSDGTITFGVREAVISDICEIEAEENADSGAAGYIVGKVTGNDSSVAYNGTGSDESTWDLEAIISSVTVGGTTYTEDFPVKITIDDDGNIVVTVNGSTLTGCDNEKITIEYCIKAKKDAGGSTEVGVLESETYTSSFSYTSPSSTVEDYITITEGTNVTPTGGSNGFEIAGYTTVEGATDFTVSAEAVSITVGGTTYTGDDVKNYITVEDEDGKIVAKLVSGAVDKDTEVTLTYKVEVTVNGVTVEEEKSVTFVWPISKLEDVATVTPHTDAANSPSLSTAFNVATVTVEDGWTVSVEVTSLTINTTEYTASEYVTLTYSDGSIQATIEKPIVDEGSGEIKYKVTVSKGNESYTKEYTVNVGTWPQIKLEDYITVTEGSEVTPTAGSDGFEIAGYTTVSGATDFTVSAEAVSIKVGTNTYTGDELKNYITVEEEDGKIVAKLVSEEVEKGTSVTLTYKVEVTVNGVTVEEEKSVTFVWPISKLEDVATVTPDTDAANSPSLSTAFSVATVTVTEEGWTVSVEATSLTIGGTDYTSSASDYVTLTYSDGSIQATIKKGIVDEGSGEIKYKVTVSKGNESYTKEYTVSITTWPQIKLDDYITITDETTVTPTAGSDGFEIAGYTTVEGATGFTVSAEAVSIKVGTNTYTGDELKNYITVEEEDGKIVAKLVSGADVEKGTSVTLTYKVEVTVNGVTVEEEKSVTFEWPISKFEDVATVTPDATGAGTSPSLSTAFNVATATVEEGWTVSVEVTSLTINGTGYTSSASDYVTLTYSDGSIQAAIKKGIVSEGSGEIKYKVTVSKGNESYTSEEYTVSIGTWPLSDSGDDYVTISFTNGVTGSSPISVGQETQVGSVIWKDGVDNTEYTVDVSLDMVQTQTTNLDQYVTLRTVNYGKYVFVYFTVTEAGKTLGTLESTGYYSLLIKTQITVKKDYQTVASATNTTVFSVE